MVHVVPALDFDVRAAVRRVSELNLTSLRTTSAETRAARLSFLTAGDNPNALRALGALLKYLEREHVVGGLGNGENASGGGSSGMAFIDIKLVPGVSHMLVDNNAITLVTDGKRRLCTMDCLFPFASPCQLPQRLPPRAASEQL